MQMLNLSVRDYAAEGRAQSFEARFVLVDQVGRGACHNDCVVSDTCRELGLHVRTMRVTNSTLKLRCWPDNVGSECSGSWLANDAFLSVAACARACSVAPSDGMPPASDRCRNDARLPTLRRSRNAGVDASVAMSSSSSSAIVSTDHRH